MCLVDALSAVQEMWDISSQISARIIFATKTFRRERNRHQLQWRRINYSAE